MQTLLIVSCPSIWSPESDLGCWVEPPYGYNEGQDILPDEMNEGDQTNGDYCGSKEAINTHSSSSADGAIPTIEARRQYRALGSAS